MSRFVLQCREPNASADSGVGPFMRSKRFTPEGVPRRRGSGSPSRRSGARWWGAAPALAVAVAAVLATTFPSPAQGQAQGRSEASLADLTATPEDAATLFLRSVRAIRWGAAARFMHPSALERFRTLVHLMSEPDTTGGVRAFLTGTDAAGFDALSAATVFERAMDATLDELPGLMHAVFDRDDTVVGHVAEATDTAYVVYRTLARIQGAEPEIEVMQVVATAEGWRVAWSQELDVFDTALRGVARPVRPPPP